MAVYRQIHISFWQDPFVLTLTPEEKYFYLYLMTNSKTSQCGVYELPKQVIVFETGYNLDTVDKLLGKFTDYEKIQYSLKTKEIFLLNWLKYNFSKSPKVFNCITSEINSIKEFNFKKELKNTVSILYQTVPIDSGEEEEKEEEKEKEEKEEEKEKERGKQPKQKGKFTIPTIQEVQEYCKTQKYLLDIVKWFAFYESNGWKVGKNPMKSWKASLTYWEKNNGGFKNGDKPGGGFSKGNNQRSVTKNGQSESERYNSRGLPDV
jgi:hypothetical protein